MLDEPWIQTLITVLCSVIASSGFWVYMTNKLEKHDAKTEMILGLGHDRIMHLGMKYIERNYITKDEYENLYIYLYEPYKRLGGNGSVKKIMAEIDKLHIYKSEKDYELSQLDPPN